jgi:hydrogenase maturation protein HypF
MVKLRLLLNGTVQGVGFRPFVYRTAKSLGLPGYVINDTSGVIIEVEGMKNKIDTFLLRLYSEKPPLANIFYEEAHYEEPVGFSDFEIRSSTTSQRKEVMILPDIATCMDCEKELLDPSDRRYLYPFINCTNCGPRFTIIEGLPYDRPNTTMRHFQMCHECDKEYHDHDDRRFHAQPNACPECGPRIWLVDSGGKTITEGDDALDVLLRLVKEGKVLSVKGIGGFHLLCDARNDSAVNVLRERKRRPDKPFAVMFRDIGQVRDFAEPTVLEESLLISPARPIVLIRKKNSVLNAVAPGLKTVGTFLPYSPLHHFILERLDFPVVATSGNFSDEPIVKDNSEAIERLSSLSDVLLLHDRPIQRRCDDSIAKSVGGYPQIIRRSRGYVPLPVLLPFKLKNRVLAVGGQEKNTFAIGDGNRILMSQHIGDMEWPESMEYFEEAYNDLRSLHDFNPEVVVYDLHPRYESSRWALKKMGVKKMALQHHYAHILSCMAEHGLTERVAGISWDGTGYGEDGTLWGGEFLICDLHTYERRYHFRPLRLIGGEKAVREPRRVALSILFELYRERAISLDIPPVRSFSEKELSILWSAWEKGINSPLCSSVGRLFDALASFLDIIQVCSFEAQAAMMIEDEYDPAVRGSYSYTIQNDCIDWLPLFQDILRDGEREKAPSRFINTLAAIALDSARLLEREKVCLSGGVFQNSPLSGKIDQKLRKDGFSVHSQKLVPSNDGGISLGQALYGGMQ